MTSDASRDPSALIVLTATRSEQLRVGGGEFRSRQGPGEALYPSHVILRPHPQDAERSVLQTRALSRNGVWLTAVEADFTPGQLRDLFNALRDRLNDLEKDHARNR